MTAADTLTKTMTPRSAVLVQGTPASGTSILSCVMSLIAQEQFEDPKEYTDDPFPHLGQSSAVAGLNRRILQELGSGWGRPGLFYAQGKGVAESAPLIRAMTRDRYLELALGVLRTGSARGELLILQDPSLCLLHDLWDTALRATGHDIRTVHVFRHPLEVAASLHAGHNFPNTKSLQLWVQYNLASLSTLPDHPAPIVISSRDVMQPDEAFVASLRANLSIRDPLLLDTAVVSEWKRLTDEAAVEPVVADRVVQRSPVIPSLVKRLHALLTEWETRSAPDRARELGDLNGSFEDQSLFAGNLVQIKLPEAVPVSAPAVAQNVDEPRKLLLHYHLFKNAGTSVDAILRRNFGDRWVNVEFPPPAKANHQEAIRTLILDNPRLCAISSHTLMLPVPRIDGFEILPILFVRHPLDRMKSAYEFERRQDGMTVAARIARDTDFAGYLKTRLGNPGDRSCRNFQVNRLAMAVPGAEPELDRALAAVDQLPFVGLVEEFAASATTLQHFARAMFPDFASFEAWENSTKARHRTLDERLDEIRIELGDVDFADVLEANAGDLVLWERVREASARQAGNADHADLRSESEASVEFGT